MREYEKPWELYDLETDRAEMNNLARTEPRRTVRMVAMWVHWAQQKQVAFPERFNMYEYLNQQNQAGKSAKQKAKRQAKQAQAAKPVK